MNTTPLCFLKGTRIATPDGEIAVERLVIGGNVITHSGAVRRIEWIGTGRVQAKRGRRNAATPVIVRKGAFDHNVPSADLRVTKAHSVYLDDVLIPVEFLVNHRSIVWDDHAQEITIYHIELNTHDVLLANGAPAESYRDDGNRWLFQNANSGWHLPPKEPRAPVLTGGPVVDAIWRRLLDRCGQRPEPRTTEDPDLHMVVDGVRVDSIGGYGRTHLFQLDRSCASIKVVSRAVTPAEIGMARDPRRLGVALRRIAVFQDVRSRAMDAADEMLTDGFHAFEPDSDLRWTDGEAELPAALFEGFEGPWNWSPMLRTQHVTLLMSPQAGRHEHMDRIV